MSTSAAPVELASNLDHRNNQVAETPYFTKIRSHPHHKYDTSGQTGDKTTSRTNGREPKLVPDGSTIIKANWELTDTWSIICTIARLCCCFNARLSRRRTRDVCSVSWTAFCICTTEVPSVYPIRSMAGHMYNVNLYTCLRWIDGWGRRINGLSWRVIERVERVLGLKGLKSRGISSLGSVD